MKRRTPAQRQDNLIVDEADGGAFTSGGQATFRCDEQASIVDYSC